MAWPGARPSECCAKGRFDPTSTQPLVHAVQAIDPVRLRIAVESLEVLDIPLHRARGEGSDLTFGQPCLLGCADCSPQGYGLAHSVPLSGASLIEHCVHLNTQ